MKKLIISMLLLFPLFLAGQTLPMGGVVSDKITFSTLSGLSSYTIGDCEQRESLSAWTPTDSLATCEHDWCYADWKDVNEVRLWTTAQYCPCGCGGSTNEARVCRKCLLNQRRIRSYWYVKVEKKSEYQQLTDRKSGQ